MNALTKRLDKLDGNHGKRTIFVFHFNHPQAAVDAAIEREAGTLKAGDDLFVFNTTYENRDGSIAPPTGEIGVNVIAA